MDRFYHSICYKTLLLAVVALFANMHQADAAQAFTSTYKSSYIINETGSADVTSYITISNLSNDVFATTYTLVLKQIAIYDIAAYHGDTKLDVIKKENNNETSLDIRLSDFVIGEGNSTELKISYKSSSIAGKSGNIWNINIPRTQSDSITSADITVEIPKSFGPKIYVSPTPLEEVQKEASITYTFPKNSLLDSNVSASFGNAQTLNFRLKYQIENPNLYKSNYEIALPPTIKDSQLVVYKNIFPQPTDYRIDKDGNYIAVFRLKPKEKILVSLIGYASIKGGQINMAASGKFNEVPKNLQRQYTKSDNFWETESQLISNLAGKLKDENLTIAQNAQKIYEYLIMNFTYDFDIAKKDFVDRKGAVAALSDKKGWGCMEFTDSFIAIARAMGIPAREINGYALTTTENTKPISISLKNGDLLHAWPEFYDPKLGWLQIDPTWGNTSNTDYFSKRDTNHFAFVMKGLDSSYPLPAGAYRQDNLQKLVEVDYSQTADEENIEMKPDFTITEVFNWNIFSSIRGEKRLKVSNKGKIIIFTENGKQIPPGKSDYINAKDTNIKITNAFSI